MKEFFTVFTVLLAVLVLIPYFTVKLMSKAIDNDSHGSAETVEEYAAEN